jgi:tetratricopeptide (TPR) repeat protein
MTSTNKLQSEKLADVAALLKESKYQEAIDICSGIILEESDCYAAFNARSQIFLDLGKHEDALRDITKLIELRPNSPCAFIERAALYLELGDDQLAIGDADFVIATGEDYFINVAHFYKAVASFNLGQKQNLMDLCSKLPLDFKFYVKTLRHGGRLLTRDDLVRFATTLCG